MKKPGTLIIACLAAATAGVALGMLIAPENGAKLRAGLKGFAEDLISKLSNQASEPLSEFESSEETDAGTPGNS